jgi:hypothetical protein
MAIDGTDLFINEKQYTGTSISNIEINENSISTLVMRLYFVVHTYMTLSVTASGCEAKDQILFGHKVIEKNLATR